MKPAESFIGQPIRSLQTMLRTLARLDDRLLSVIPDGVYTRQTADAVAAFQRSRGLNATGVADQTTWEEIVRDYRLAEIEYTKAEPIQITLNPGEVIRRGDEHRYMNLIQSMLILISDLHPNLPAPDHTGVFDEDTERSILALQVFSGLPPTGVLDKRTWKVLALQFARAADEISTEND